MNTFECFCRVRTDLDSAKSTPLTSSNHEEGSLMIVTLLLTGRATPYIHNGVVNVGDESSYVGSGFWKIFLELQWVYFGSFRRFLNTASLNDA